MLQKLLDYIDTMPFIGSPEHSNLVNVIQQEFMPIEKETDDEWLRMECEIKSLNKYAEKRQDEIEDLRETLDRYVLMCGQYKEANRKLELKIERMNENLLLGNKEEAYKIGKS